MIRLLYLLDKNGDDICLGATTAQAITGEPFVHASLSSPACSGPPRPSDRGFVRRTDPDPQRLTEADRHTMLGLTLTDAGRRYLEDVLASQPRAAPPPRAAAHGV